MPPISQPAGDAPARIEWDLTDIYDSQDAWRADKVRLDGEVTDLARFKGQLGKSAASLSEALDTINATGKDLIRFCVFAFLQADEDRRMAEAEERRGEAVLLMATFEKATSFFVPELLRVGSATVERYLDAEPGLGRHAFNVRNMLRMERHALSEEAEAVVAGASAMRQGPERVFATLTSTDMRFPTVTLSTGEQARLDQAGYARYRTSRHRADRKRVFDAYWNVWRRYTATLGQTLDTHVKSHVFEARARGYPGALDAALAKPNIPISVYRKLIAAARRHLPSLHRYLRLRKRVLRLDELRYYDLHSPLVAFDRSFALEEAKALTLAAAAPLGDDYVSALQEGLAGDWMHVYPQTGKAPGAYMYGTIYDVHPYLLLNYNGKYEDLTTFVHEWGHAMHTVLAKRRNSYETAGYVTFMSEVASITNEVLLQEHLLAQNLSDRERLLYLGTALETIRGTFFRQVILAEFELAIHALAEQGEALSGARMTEIYRRLCRLYHGCDQGLLAYDDTYAIEWASIPHFYGNFRVFQYATSIAAGTMFAERILGDDARASRNYMAVLSAGGSRYAYELLRDNLVDLAADAPYDMLIARMNRMMDTLEMLPHGSGSSGVSRK